MSKIPLDKYYTPPELAKRLIAKSCEIFKDITEFLEPSAGDGSFSLLLPNCLAYDIEPGHPSVTKQDFLTLDLPYKKGRVVIGNPPFGPKMYLAQMFYKKAAEIGDFIAFILPASQLNNNSLYQFDLVYSEDLGVINFSGVKLHCCFNCYRRPSSGLNPKPSKRLKDITLIRQDNAKYESAAYDLRICYWGNASAGKVLQEGEKYSGEYKVQIHNTELKDRIIAFFHTFDWHSFKPKISMLKLQQHDIYRALKQAIPEIQ